MNKETIIQKILRFAGIAAGIAVVAGLIYFFLSIVTYLLIAGLVALVGRPLTRMLMRVKYSTTRTLPAWLCAMITLFSFYLAIVLIVYLIAPPLVEEFQHLSRIKPEAVVSFLHEFSQTYFGGISSRLNIDFEKEMNAYLHKLFNSFFHESFLNTVTSVATGLGDVLIGVFSVSFISFFFLKDGDLLPSMVFFVTPTPYVRPMLRVADDVKRLLRRYMLGLFLQTGVVAILYMVGLWVLGIKNAVLIGFFAGAVNTIPYIGAVLAWCFALMVTISANVDYGFATITPLLPQVLFVCGIVKLIDDFVLQPLIYSNSVKAHPLEIFLVILAAGKLGGVFGMIVALPVYTVIRVVAKEFLSENKIVRALTEGL